MCEHCQILTPELLFQCCFLFPDQRFRVDVKTLFNRQAMYRRVRPYLVEYLVEYHLVPLGTPFVEKSLIYSTPFSKVSRPRSVLR